MKNIPTVPRIKSLMSALRFVKNPIPVINEQIDVYGPNYYFYLGGVAQRGLLSADPEVAQHVLQKNHKNYRKSNIQTDFLGQYVGKGLLTTDGPYWLKQRRLIQPGFHRKKLERLAGLMHAVIDDFIEKFDLIAAQGATIDIYEEMLEIAFHIIAKSTFSESVNDVELNELSSNITVLQEFLVRRIRQPYLEPWFKLSGQIRKNAELKEETDKILLGYIRKRIASGEQQDDLLDMLLAARYEDTGEGMTEQQVLDESKIIFLAGHETSANALSWLWYLLATHPEILSKLRAELDALDTDKPGFADLPKLEYCKCVIEEAMRLYPPAWITDRVAVADDQVAGIDIKKGSIVITYIYGVHHSNLLWDNPEKFDPERFRKANKKEHKPYSYFPFGGGPRLCIGNNFALMEMQFILARMAKRFDFEIDPNQQIVAQPLVTLRPRYGIKAKLKKRVLNGQQIPSEKHS